VLVENFVLFQFWIVILLTVDWLYSNQQAHFINLRLKWFLDFFILVGFLNVYFLSVFSFAFISCVRLSWLLFLAHSSSACNNTEFSSNVNLITHSIAMYRYLLCDKKLTYSQLSLPHDIKAKCNEWTNQNKNKSWAEKFRKQQKSCEVSPVYCIWWWSRNILCLMTLQSGTTSTAQSGCTAAQTAVRWRSTFSSALCTISDFDTWSTISIRSVDWDYCFGWKWSPSCCALIVTGWI